MVPLSRRSSIVVLLFMALVLLQPLIWRAAGVQALAFENRPVAPVPTLAWSRIFDPALYDSINRFIEDHNPLRWYAVVAQARLRFALTGEVTTPPHTTGVLAGKDGWLFIEEALRQQCWSAAQLQRGLDVLDRMNSALKAAGKIMVFTVSPNKASIYPEYLSRGEMETAACSIQSRDLLRRLISQSNVGVYVDAFDLLKNARRSESRFLYSRLDTHWTELGSAYFVSGLMRKLRKGDFEPARFMKTGETKRLPDLSRLSGLFYPELSDNYRFDFAATVHREPHEIAHAGKGRPYVRQVATAPVLNLDGRKVIALHDSFFYVSWDQIACFFSDVLYVHWTAFDAYALGALARDADIVIIQSVEREVFHRLAAMGPKDAVAFERGLRGEGR